MTKFIQLNGVNTYQNGESYASGELISYQGTIKRVKNALSTGSTPVASDFSDPFSTRIISGASGVSAVAGDRIVVNNSVTVTLPASPANGDTVTIAVISGVTATFARNSSTINGSAADYVTSRAGTYTLTYHTSTWNVTFVPLTESSRWVITTQNNSVSGEANRAYYADGGTFTLPSTNLQNGDTISVRLVIPGVSWSTVGLTISSSAPRYLRPLGTTSGTATSISVGSTRVDANLGGLDATYIFTYDSATSCWYYRREKEGQSFFVSDFAVMSDDTFKTLKFNVSSIASLATRTITMPNADVNLGDIVSAVSYAPSTNVLTLTKPSGTFTATIPSGYVEPKSASFTAVSNRRYVLRNGGSNITITLPASPTDGDCIEIQTWDVPALRTVILDANGKSIIIGGFSTYTIAAPFIYQTFKLYYFSSSSLWQLSLFSEGGLIDGSWSQYRSRSNYQSLTTFEFPTTNSTSRTVTFPDYNLNLGGLPYTNSLNSNSVTGTRAVVVGGGSNTAGGQYSGVLNGLSNSISGNYCNVVMGESNTIDNTKNRVVIVKGNNVQTAGVQSGDVVIQNGIGAQNYQRPADISHSLSGLLYAGVSVEATTDGAAGSTSNRILACSGTTVGGIRLAVHTIDFMVQSSNPLGQGAGIWCGTRRVIASYDGSTTTILSTNTLGTDYVLGYSAQVFEATTSSNYLIATFSATGAPGQQDIMVQAVVRSSYNGIG